MRQGNAFPESGFEEIAVNDPYALALPVDFEVDSETTCFSKNTVKTWDNALRFSLNKVSPEVKKQVLKRWSELKARNARGDVTSTKDIEDIVAASKSGDWDSFEFVSTETDETVNEHGDHSEWVPWATFEKKQGAVMAMELVRLGSVKLRTHRGLVGKDHAIPYPQNQECRHITEFEHNKRRKTQTVSCVKRSAASAEEAKAFSDGLQSVQVPLSMQCEQPPLALENGQTALADAPFTDEEQKKQKEELKKQIEAAIKNAKLSHADWDRKRQDWKGTIARSKNNKNTVGCRLELDLENGLKEGGKVDEALMKHHTFHVAGGELTQDDIEDMKVQATALARLIKTCARKVPALQNSFNA